MSKFVLRKQIEARKTVDDIDVLNYFKKSNVAPDGNCGYRSFAVSFLANGGEEHLDKLGRSNLLPDAKQTLQALKRCSTGVDSNCSDLRTRLQQLGDEVKKPERSAISTKYWFNTASSADPAARLTCSVLYSNSGQRGGNVFWDPSRYERGKERCKAVIERGLHNRVYGAMKYDGGSHFDALVYKKDKDPLYIGQTFVPHETVEIDLVSDESDDSHDDNYLSQLELLGK